MAIFEYQIAAGYNNAAGLVNIETIKPSSDFLYFWAPVSTDKYSPGIKRVRLDGVRARFGKASTAWPFDLMTFLQFKYIRDTYCNGGYSGKVTIRTRVGVNTYANFNAVLDMDEESLQRKIENREMYEGVEVRFTGMEPL